MVFNCCQVFGLKTDWGSTVLLRNLPSTNQGISGRSMYNGGPSGGGYPPPRGHPPLYVYQPPGGMPPPVGGMGTPPPHVGMAPPHAWMPPPHMGGTPPPLMGGMPPPMGYGGMPPRGMDMPQRRLGMPPRGYGNMAPSVTMSGSTGPMEPKRRRLSPRRATAATVATTVVCPNEDVAGNARADTTTSAVAATRPGVVATAVRWPTAPNSIVAFRCTGCGFSSRWWYDLHNVLQLFRASTRSARTAAPVNVLRFASVRTRIVRLLFVRKSVREQCANRLLAQALEIGSCTLLGTLLYFGDLVDDLLHVSCMHHLPTLPFDC